MNENAGNAVMDKPFLESIEVLKKTQAEMCEILSDGENVLDRLCYRDKGPLQPLGAEKEAQPQNHVETIQKLASENRKLAQRMSLLVGRLSQTI